MSRSSFLSAVADNLDRRRLEFTNLRRVLLAYKGRPLEPFAVRMAIPMVYANWEGFTKEACFLYIEHIEGSVSKCADLHPGLLGYLWTPKLRPLTGGLNPSRKRVIAELALSVEDVPVTFHTREKEIDTKSNLKYEVLQKIAVHLNLDISPLNQWAKWLDSLVNLRNNIAHGGLPQQLSYKDFDDHTSKAIGLMEAFELVLSEAARNRSFLRA